MTMSTRARPDGKGDIDAIWKRYRRYRRTDERNALVVHYAHLVDTHAARLSGKLPSQIAFDEIRSAAFDGLMQAVESYDHDRDVRFATFCQQRICGAVVDWLRRVDTQSRTVRNFEKKRAQISELLDTEIGRPPTNGEIAARMRIPLRRYESLARLSQLGNRVYFSSLESSACVRQSDLSRGWDILDTRASDPSRRISREMLTEHLSKGFTRDERLILVLYYYEDLTMAEIGTVLELSESRVSQIHKGILARLRLRFGAALAEELAV